ncbi:GNAT family N-acetyltransferase [Brevibacillus sp. TJ4]|uniref:GNAT family N-acetyltransferase n=1 Tax=Brevibacillus sp. TJ4 TaxID=3234853 RepID=UPI0037D5A718
MYTTRLAVLNQDDDFQFELYASTRQEEMALWGWSEWDKREFLHMQFRMQQHSYASQYPELETRIILAEEERIGRILTACTSEAIHLVDLSLLPPYRNKGIGSELIRVLMDKSCELQLPLLLQVLQVNTAKRLYERLGFQVVDASGLYVKMAYMV